MRQSIASIRHEGLEKVASVFQVVSKELRSTRKGKPFLRIILADSTGQLPAVVWDNVEMVSEQFEVGSLLEITGELMIYRSEFQIKPQRIRRRNVGALVQEDYPSLDAEMLAAARMPDGDGPWVSALLDRSEAARIATEKKTNEIVAKLSAGSTQIQKHEDTNATARRRLHDSHVQDIIRKYKKSDPEQF